MVTHPNPKIKDLLMDKITPKTSFGQWFSSINLKIFKENVKTMKLDYYFSDFFKGQEDREK
ncbi:hypothetical protein CIL05_17495 [Virgibacillus profundi]|uniref:Uncharacterized protein n=1 Tax=Virgibacillus profundi TaxID=2024555 RepID=A0A2A2IAM2_9BACI|nr:hypothetical protein CIL05_17495 [Virgibacillus profundi]PXY52475.1 hypothetical protein CIT14_16930 [Virgibacillus profundi]